MYPLALNSVSVTYSEGTEVKYPLLFNSVLVTYPDKSISPSSLNCALAISFFTYSSVAYASLLSRSSFNSFVMLMVILPKLTRLLSISSKRSLLSATLLSIVYIFSFMLLMLLTVSF